MSYRTWLTAGLLAASLIATTTTAPSTAAPAPPDTTTTPTYGPATTVTWFVVDRASSCLVQQAGATADNRRVGGAWGMEALVYNVCTDQQVLVVRAEGTNTATSGLRVSADRRTATFTASGPVRYIDEDGNVGAVAGTFSMNQRLTFGTLRTDPSPDNVVYCVPLETDPDTGLPLPGTLWMRYHFTGATGDKRGDVTAASGTWTVDLTDGTHLDFTMPPAELFGGFVRSAAGSLLEQVSGPQATCQQPH